MKIKTNILLVAFCFISAAISAQTVDLGANFSTGNAPFYKDVPGVQIGFSYHLKKQYLFTELKTSQKNNSYSQIRNGFLSDDNVEMQSVKGKLNASSLKLGIAHKIKNSDEMCLSIGGFASLNYFKFNEDISSYDFYTTREGSIWSSTRDELIKNRWGMGCFIDMEIKHIAFKNTSLFSRFGADLIGYTRNPVRDDSMNFIGEIKSIEFVLGLRIDLKKNRS